MSSRGKLERRRADKCCDAVNMAVDMAQLWTVHVALTREVVIAAVSSSPALQSSIDALLENQQDLGRNFAQYYGEARGRQLAALLTSHINQAVQIVSDSIKGLDTSVLVALWYRNADEIAAFQARVIKTASYDILRELWYSHLDCTLDEAKMAIANNAVGSLAEYELCLQRIKTLSNYLAYNIAASLS